MLGRALRVASGPVCQQALRLEQALLEAAISVVQQVGRVGGKRRQWRAQLQQAVGSAAQAVGRQREDDGVQRHLVLARRAAVARRDGDVGRQHPAGGGSGGGLQEAGIVGGAREPQRRAGECQQRTEQGH